MKIAYGVSGEGLGHVTRSIDVIRYLIKKGYKVQAFASGRAHDYLIRHNVPCIPLPHIPLIYTKNKLSIWRSALAILQVIVTQGRTTLKMLEKEFKDVDLVVSDFEYFTAKAARGKPLINANNISLPHRTRVSTRGVPWLSLMFDELVEGLATKGSVRYVIPHFSQTESDDNTILTDIAVRKEVRNLKPSQGKHILVYQTSPTCLPLLEMLDKTDQQYKVYGFGEKENTKHLEFNGFNEDQFLHDLRTAKSVIIGGGFSLMSEAIYLNKPILSVPLLHHAEQILNGRLLEREGFGLCRLHPKPNDVQMFLDRMPEFRKNLEKYKPDTQSFAKGVLKAIESL